MGELPRGTVTFLFTDIEGSTRLLEQLGAEAYAEALAAHRQVIRAACAGNGGVEVDTEGDALFVAFPTAQGALDAAAAFTQGLATGPIRVRVGLHTGTPLLAEDNYVGMDVHRAARIAAAGHGGQVLVSAATAALTGSEGLRDLGEHRFKDLSAPERVYQLGEGEFPRLKTLYQTNLPVQPTALVGRERELAQVLDLLQEGRIVTLTGAGGSGKTRLALQAAAEVVEEFKDGVFWISLAPVTDADLVLPTIASTVGAKEELVRFIQEKRLLLLLDNLEQVLDCAPALSELLSSCPNLSLLCTSRAPLRIDGEREYDVAPLPEDDAVTLFRSRASVAEPEDAVREICRQLDGLPLAIELAAARTRILPPDKLVERLAQRLPLLTDGRRDAPERQRTLRATIEWSYDLLASEEQQLFGRLGVFAGSFELESAEAVAGASLDGLAALVEQSLLRSGDLGRFFMLETIREFALERLESSADGQDVRRRHAEYFLEIAESTEPEARGSEEAKWLSRLKSDQANFRAALSWALESGEMELALRLAGSLHSFWYHAGFLVEGRRWAERALAAVGGDEFPIAQARALSTAGEFANLAGETVVARGYLERSLALYEHAGDLGKMPAAYTQLGHVAMHEGNPELARSLYERVLEHESTDPWCTPAVAFCNLGFALLESGRIDEAKTTWKRGLAHARKDGSSLTTAVLLQNLASAALVERDLVACARLLRESCELLRSVPDPQLICEGVELCASLAAARDAPLAAARLGGAATAQRRELGVTQVELEVDAKRELLDRARSAVATHEWEREWGVGEALGQAAALEEALETLG
jgi:predicted ATPase/class 3 adenylate cyclase